MSPEGIRLAVVGLHWVDGRLDKTDAHDFREDSPDAFDSELRWFSNFQVTGLQWVGRHLDRTNTSIFKEGFPHTVDNKMRWFPKGVVFGHGSFIVGVGSVMKLP